MTTQIDGLNIYFEIWGQGKELVILHGWGGNGREFHSIRDILAQKFKLIIPDLPGFGNSSLPRKPWSLTNYAIFVKKFLKDLKIKNPYFIGHSFGGSILIKLVTTESFKQKIILVDTAGVRKLTIKKIVGPILAKSGKLILNLPLLNKLYSYGRSLLYEFINEWDYVDAENLKETFINIINEDLSSSLRKIKNQTLIIWGENDQVTPLTDAYFIHQQIKNSKLVIIDGAGHFPFLDNPKKFCQVITKFINYS